MEEKFRLGSRAVFVENGDNLIGRKLECPVRKPDIQIF